MKGYLAVLLQLIVVFSAYAVFPGVMNYQGKLTNTSGIGTNDTLPMQFRIYNTEFGGSPIWTETHDGTNEVPIVKGLFDVRLGEINPLNLPFDVQYWLEIEVNRNTLMPRVKLATSPYAFRAAVADSITGVVVAARTDTFISHWDSIRGIPPDLADGDDNTTYSAGYGLNLESGEFTVDSVVIQARVNEACGPGYAIKAIHEDGTVECVEIGAGGGGFQQIRADASPWLVDSLTLHAGANITLTQIGDSITIAGQPGTVTNVIGISPISVTSGTTTPNISISQANSTTNGYLTSTDWSRFDAAGGQVILVDATNYTTISVTSNRIINVRQRIALPGGTKYRKFDYDNLLISGGGFTSTTTDTVEFGNYCVVVGAYFENIVFDGNYTTFINCEFRGNIGRFPWGANFVGCYLYNVTQNVNYSINMMDKCDIENSTILRVAGIANSEISGSIIAGTALNFEAIGSCSDNYIYNSKIYMKGGTVFANNRCRDTKLNFCNYSYGMIIIDGNYFDNKKDTETEIIEIDCSYSGWKNWMISNNTFILQSADPQAIRVFNNDGNSYDYSILKICDNAFLKGTKAINHTSNINTYISNNVTKDTPLGATATSDRILSNNQSF